MGLEVDCLLLTVRMTNQDATCAPRARNGLVASARAARVCVAISSSRKIYATDEHTGVTYVGVRQFVCETALNLKQAELDRGLRVVRDV
jgi:hypothetical protein